VLLRSVLVAVAALALATLGARTPALLPDLVLPVVVAGALRSGRTGGLLLGLAAGWVVDLVPPGAAVVGTGALAYAACGLVAGAGRREGVVPWGWVAAVGAAASAVLAGCRVALAVATGSPVSGPGVVGSFLLTTTLCALVVPLLVRAERRLSTGRAA
jgi:rod shape-determining protein MreD